MNDDEPKVFARSLSEPTPLPVNPAEPALPPVGVEPIHPLPHEPKAPAPGHPQEYAAWISRVGAYLLDGAIEFLALLVLSLVFGLVASLFIYALSGLIPALGDLNDPESSVFAQTFGTAFFILSMSISFFNRVVIQWYYGASIGKRIVGLAIVLQDEGDGHAVGFWRMLLRYFATWFSSFLFGIGYLMPLWMPKRQTLHDLICRTVVVIKK